MGGEGWEGEAERGRERQREAKRGKERQREAESRVPASTNDITSVSVQSYFKNNYGSLCLKLPSMVWL